MFENYNDRARRVIFFARFETSQFGAAEIEVEHLLFGLMREEKNLTRYLNQSVMIFDAIRKELEEHMPRQPKPIVSVVVDLPLSAAAKRVLEFAASEAEAMGHQVAPEHRRLECAETDSAAAGAHFAGIDLTFVRGHHPARDKRRPDLRPRGNERELGSGRGPAVREASWFRSSEMGDEMNVQMRLLLSLRRSDCEGCSRLHGLADGSKLIALAIELEDVKARKRFIDRIKEKNEE